MNFNLDDREKALLKSVAIALLTVVAMLFGFEVKPIAQPAATGIGVRDVGASRFNGVVNDGNLQFTQATAKILPGGTGVVVRDQGDSQNNFALWSTGVLSVPAGFSTGGFQNVAPAAGVIATTTYPLTPTGSFQIVSSNQNAVTSTMAGAGNGLLPGTTVTMINTVTNTVGFTAAAGSLSLGANRQLGISDTLTLIWTGTSWVEVAFANN